jgi:sugar phosphate isomerase/epimerase
MRLEVYRSIWGYEAPVPEAAGEIAAAGYDGLEAVLPERAGEQAELVDAARSAGLGFIPLIVTTTTPSVDEQLVEFRRHAEEIGQLGVPKGVMHTGRDHWSTGEAVGFYEAAVAIEAELGVEIAHETHRGRPLNTPWGTAAILAEVPELRLCCDFSHWVVVGERMLEDQEEAVGVAVSHCLHTHTRQGSDQAPQVSIPSDPAHDAQRAVFERWWQAIWASQEERGFELTTATPEYGPPPYQPVYAGQQDAAAELRETCDRQADRLREMFNDRTLTNK